MDGHNSYYYGRREYHRSQDENAPLILTVLVLAILGFVFYVLARRFHIRILQVAEGGAYLICLIAAAFVVARYLWTR